MDKNKILTKIFLISFLLSIFFSYCLFSKDYLPKLSLNQVISFFKWTAITISPNAIWYTNATGYNHVYFCIVR